MQSARKFYFLSEGMSFVYFWVAISIPYLLYRGLSPSQALSLMSIYQLMGVILEYPTGVFGDRFGYKLSLIIADILMAVSMFMLGAKGDFFWYLFALFVLALGNSFTSGNTLGLLNSVTLNVRRDTASRTALGEFVIFLSAVIGTWLGAISYELALYLSGAIILAAIIPLGFIEPAKTKAVVQPIRVILKDSFRSLRTPVLRQIFFILAVFGGFFFSVKSIFGSFGQLYGYSLTSIGWLIGLGGLVKSFASLLYARLQKAPKLALAIAMAIFILTSGFSGSILSAVLLLAFMFVVGFLMSHIDGDIHELASDHIRASLFSFKRLTIRLFSSIFLFFIGLAIDGGWFAYLTLITGLIMFMCIYLTRDYLQKERPI